MITFETTVVEMPAADQESLELVLSKHGEAGFEVKSSHTYLESSGIRMAIFVLQKPKFSERFNALMRARDAIFCSLSDRAHAVGMSKTYLDHALQALKEAGVPMPEDQK